MTNPLFEVLPDDGPENVPSRGAWRRPLCEECRPCECRCCRDCGAVGALDDDGVCTDPEHGEMVGPVAEGEPETRHGHDGAILDRSNVVSTEEA